MKDIEVSKIIEPVAASDGAGVKLKRSIVLKVGIKEFNLKYAFDRFQIQKIDDFLDNPRNYKISEDYDIPDGSPIGDFSCDY